jgi:hypothetical protein
MGRVVPLLPDEVPALSTSSKQQLFFVGTFDAATFVFACSYIVT